MSAQGIRFPKRRESRFVETEKERTLRRALDFSSKLNRQETRPDRTDSQPRVGLARLKNSDMQIYIINTHPNSSDQYLTLCTLKGALDPAAEETAPTERPRFKRLSGTLSGPSDTVLQRCTQNPMQIHTTLLDMHSQHSHTLHKLRWRGCRTRLTTPASI